MQSSARLFCRTGSTLFILALAAIGLSQPADRLLSISAVSATQIRVWDSLLQRMLRDDELRIRQLRNDTLLQGRLHERMDQYHGGVRVVGGDVARQFDENGNVVSLFGTLFNGIDVDVTPRYSPQEAKAILEALYKTPLGASRLPELVVLPTEEGRYALAYRERIAGPTGLVVHFLDAHSGRPIGEQNDLQTAAAIGVGTGVLNDNKKVSVLEQHGRFLAWDTLRRPPVLTFNMNGDLARTVEFLNGVTLLGIDDVASSPDNVWTDGPVVDAHVYTGWTLDYLFKRFGKKGIDSGDTPIANLMHTVRWEDLLYQSSDVIQNYMLSTFYAGNGVIVYGNGLPEPLMRNGKRWNHLAGALDIVAHEVGHAVIDFSSRLSYENEAGSLNEAFADILATGVEFFYQEPGTGPLKSDYLIGEDVVTPGGLRSLASPNSYGHPDHYSLRRVLPEAGEIVQHNSSIVSHTFYLAIEGGVHRFSKQTVQGVGGANREQIERIFFRAFTELLPSKAGFAMARTASIHAARELYGAGSAAERAVTQAWQAVGVN
jgi:bacillolysin